ncbi:MAG: type II secretion system F family protein [Planctomycetota bacterium]
MLGRALGLLLSWFAWSLAGGAVLVIVTGVFGYLFTPIVGVVTPIAVLFCMLMAGRLIKKARQRRALTVVGYLEQATRLNLPIPSMLVAAQRSETGAAARRLADLRLAIQAGMPVGEAIQHYAPEVAWRDQREIAVSERMGQLRDGLSRVHRRTLRRLRSEVGEQDMVMGWSYGVVVVAVVTLAIGGLTVLVMPKYVEIFDDFDTVIPWATRVTFAVGQHIGWGLVTLAVLSVLFVAGYAPWSVLHRDEGVWSRLPGVEALLRWVPGVGRMMDDRSWSAAYGGTAGAVAAGYAMPEALRLASDAALTRRARRRLLRMADAMEDGADLTAAARVARLPDLACGLLGAAEHGDNAEEILRFLSRFHGGRFSRAWSVMRASVLPTIVIVLSLVVGWVAFSMFVPLVDLIFSVAPEWEVM